MTEIVHDAIASGYGSISCFVSMTGFDEKDLEKLSAYRVLARELGYEVGHYVLNPREGTASAPISRIPEGGK